MGFETSLRKECKEGFQDFKNYINQINDPNYLNQKHDGYLVDFNQYNNFENYINSLNNPQAKQTNEGQNNWNIESKKLRTVNINEVNNKILQDNKFIIINTELYKLICKHIDQDIYNKIVYKLTRELIDIYTIKGNRIQFRNNKNNIIDKNVLTGSNLQFSTNNINNNIINKSNITNNINNSQINNNNIHNNNANNSINNFQIMKENADKIYLYMLKYFQNENRLLSVLLNNKSQQIYQGFLVDKEWVDIWKQNSHYEIINKQFFQKNVIIETQIKNALIHEQTNNNLINDLNKIPDINNYILRDINQFEEELKKNKSFVLLNGEFLISYDKNINNISIVNCNLNFQNISIKKINGSYLSFNTNDNIINISKIIIEFNSKALHNSS